MVQDHGQRNNPSKKRQDEPTAHPTESDPRFPSGRWIGYYRQGNTQARQRLTLTFVAGAVVGEGKDPGGEFLVTGAYDLAAATIALKKVYTTHSVEYTGQHSDDGVAGLWTIRGFGGTVEDRGRFLIWPDTTPAPEDTLFVEEALPIILRMNP